MTYQEWPAQALLRAEVEAYERYLEEPGRRHARLVREIEAERRERCWDPECTRAEWQTAAYETHEPDTERPGYGPLYPAVPLTGGARITGEHEAA